MYVFNIVYSMFARSAYKYLKTFKTYAEINVIKLLTPQNS